jgi:hypothetical protein
MQSTISKFGTVLLGKILDLNDIPTEVLAAIFKYANDQQMALVDLTDLKKLLSYLSEGDGAAEITKSYGKISSSTAGTILLKTVGLEQQGLETLFGETSLNTEDLYQKVNEKGLISLLNIADVQNQPALYFTFLISLLAKIFYSLPEAGDLVKHKLVFFFEEAHLLFNNSSKAFLRQIKQVIRLICYKRRRHFLFHSSSNKCSRKCIRVIG